MDQWEREQDEIDQAYERGEITAAEHTKLSNELAREHRGAAEEAAGEAYEREMDNWGYRR